MGETKHHESHGNHSAKVNEHSKMHGANHGEPHREHSHGDTKGHGGKHGQKNKNLTGLQLKIKKFLLDKYGGVILQKINKEEEILTFLKERYLLYKLHGLPNVIKCINNVLTDLGKQKTEFSKGAGKEKEHPKFVSQMGFIIETFKGLVRVTRVQKDEDYAKQLRSEYMMKREEYKEIEPLKVIEHLGRDNIVDEIFEFLKLNTTKRQKPIDKDGVKREVQHLKNILHERTMKSSAEQMLYHSRSSSRAASRSTSPVPDKGKGDEDEREQGDGDREDTDQV